MLRPFDRLTMSGYWWAGLARLPPAGHNGRMSKLSQKISRVGRFDSAPLGFGAMASPKSESTMLLVARLAASESKRLGDLAKAGVDVALIDSPSAQKLPDAGDLIVGAVLSSGDGALAAGLREAGYDFLCIDPNSVQADVLLEEQLGFMFPADPAAEDSELRLLETLNLDAVLLPAVNGPLTVRQQLSLRRVALLTRKPMLVAVSDVLEGNQLRGLRDSGTVGLVVDGKADKTVAAMRKAIDELPARRRRREDRQSALVPAMGLRQSTEPEEDE